MALSTHRQKTLTDRVTNSNYQNKSNYQARLSKDGDALSNRVNGSGILVKTKTLPTSSLASKTSAKIFKNYNNLFVDAGSAKSNSLSTSMPYYTAHGPGPCFADKADSINTSSVDCNSYHETRLSGGANRNQQEHDKLILSPSQCKLPPPGLGHYLKPKNPKVNVVHLQLSGRHTSMNLDCHDLTLPRMGKRRTRGTQTLYRESSAQTLPYLPGVSNDPKELETLEVFKLPTILPGDGPPGLYEVEVLERARKRWAFANALKENFRKQLEAAREQAKLQQHQHILEAFEWEHWLEREEYIQECQMLRLEILIRMFDKRERQMHTASHNRIQKSYESIEAKRQAALKKNEVEYGRALRRLEIKHAKQPRVWRKEHITQELGDPSSEFYAPKMRYGVNPNRRHYTASRKHFNMRMNDLEKTAVKMDYKHLKCPFAKLKEWSKPKQVLQEVEQNFCSEVNLKKLYDSMRTLRESTKIQKTIPLCLTAKVHCESTIQEEEYPKENDHILKVKINQDVGIIQIPIDDSSTENSEDSNRKRQQEDADYRDNMEELRQQKTAESHNRELLQRELRCEELETLIYSYEGNTIGWIMRFLSEQMCRLKEQRKLHFFTMMAKRERWHREAAEAGLRQKENCMRQEYEQLYEECDQANKEIAEKYMRDIIDTDIKDYATQKAEDHVSAMARDMDKEITGWLESFREVQNPLNYYSLRYALKDIVMPDKEKILYRLERDECINYIINDVLFVNVYRLLEPYDVSFSIATDFVDRLIDNDIYLNSSDCSSECECTELCTCSKSRYEAMAILRKVIRRAVPGRRWCTPSERVASENIRDLLDDVFERVIPKETIIEVAVKNSPAFGNNGAQSDLVDSENNVIYSAKTSSEGDYMFEIITKSLEHDEKLLLTDPDKLSADRVLLHRDDYELPQPQFQPQMVHSIPSTHDISRPWNLSPLYNQTSSDDSIIKEEKEAMEKDEIQNTMETRDLQMSSLHGRYSEKYVEHSNAIEEAEEVFQPQRVHSIPSTHDISKPWTFSLLYNETSSDDLTIKEEEEETMEKMK